MPTEKQEPVERLVDKILTAKQRDPEADTSALEREIDQLVYTLYGLTPEEIQIIEGAAKCARVLKTKRSSVSGKNCPAVAGVIVWM